MKKNITTTTASQLPNFVLAPWIVKPATKTVITPGDATPTYNKAAQAEVAAEMLKAQGRDSDGKYAPQVKPITKRKAMKQAERSSQRLDAAIDRMMAMENW